MKKLLLSLSALMLIGNVQTILGQQVKCPLIGHWDNIQLGGNWGEAYIDLFPQKKVGQNPSMNKLASNGYIDISDVYFESGINYNLVYEKETASNTYQFAVQFNENNQVRRGKIQIKKNGNKVVITGIDPIMKKQPIHGKFFESSGNQQNETQTSTHVSVPQFDEDFLYMVEDVLDPETALRTSQLKSMDKVKAVLSGYGYTYKGIDGNGINYWSKNCSLTNTFKPTAFAKGASSVVRYKHGGELSVQVFNEKSVNEFLKSLEKNGYRWKGMGMGMGALMFKKNLSDDKEKPIYVIVEKAEAYQERGGYFMIIGDDLSGTATATSNNVDNKTYDIVDEMPMFSGGKEKMIEYFSSNLQYPEQAKKNNIRGRVLISFIVEKDGSITNCKVIKSVSPELDNEAMRVISSMPAWKPGKKDEQPVRVKYTIPINFQPPSSTNK